jgi:hypothetical protein
MKHQLIMENWRKFVNEAKNKDGKEQGADGKACWKGKKYAGQAKDGSDICVPMEEEVKDKYDDEVEKDNEKKSAKARKEMGLDEKKKACKPQKGKRYADRVNGKCRSYGQAGKEKDGTDRIEPGTDKGDAYCARSAKIKKCKEPPCANDLSRKKWKCQGDKSVA